MDKDSAPAQTTCRIKASAIYRLMLIGFGIPINIMMIICALLAVAGYDTVQFNGKQIHGWLALPAGILGGVISTVLITLLAGSVCCLGLWIYSRFRRLDVKTFS